MDTFEIRPEDASIPVMQTDGRIQWLTHRQWRFAQSDGLRHAKRQLIREIREDALREVQELVSIDY